MTNLEANKDEIKKRIKNGENFGCVICKAKNKQCPQCCGDDGDDILCNVVDWLSEEYKEPIKLKQWEKDLIEAYQERLGVDHAFYSNYILEELKERGHFKGVMDTSMNTQIILENCEVIE